MQKTRFGLHLMMEIAFLLLMVVVAGTVEGRSAGDISCICTFEVNEVCGTDGVTYSNPCMARCNGGVTIEHDGICEINPEIEETCYCNYLYHPVCGSDGKTHANSDCLTKCNPGVSVVHEGACELETIELYSADSQPACSCPAVHAPVCGKDGKTYSNECEAKCSGATVKHSGRCENKYPRREKACICTPLNRPVCGSDGKTHPNINCLTKCSPGVSMVHEGACKSKMFMPLSADLQLACSCPAVLDPVCGKDGKTYSNECEAKCRNVSDYFFGACDDVCPCERTYDPVCDVISGTEYVNRCIARCRGANSSRLTSCSRDSRPYN